MIDVNRRHFMARWRGALPEPALHQYDELGLAVAHLAADDAAHPAARPVVVRPPLQVRGARPRLRWGLKLPVTPGPLGDSWGDTHFAESLKQALMRLGQEVVTYRRGSHASPASHLDDVVLGLRGLEPIHPHPGKANLLWVISHPDDVSIEELLGFDAVFAASPQWARRTSRAAGRSVQTLLQATDVGPRANRRDRESRVDDLVFVGAGQPGRRRQAVLDAVSARVPLVVHGPGWQETPVAPHVASEHVPPRELAAVYRRHRLVLSDHWPDMARNGFVANRVFDAVAAGARVISDDVPGIEELFDGAVRVYRSVDDLRDLCSPAGRDRFASDDELAVIADRVAEEHSFDRRAQALLDSALSVLEPSGDGRAHEQRRVGA
jgi:hypothetical protein